MRLKQIGFVTNAITHNHDVLYEMDDDTSAKDVRPGITQSGEKQTASTDTIDVSDRKLLKPATRGVSDADEKTTEQAQQELMKRRQQLRARITKPKIDALNRSLKKLEVGVTRGKSMADASDRQFADLEREMTEIQMLINDLRRTL